MKKITPFLWYDNNCEEAINFYSSIFKNSKIKSIAKYPGGPMEGKVMTAVFELDGQEFMAIDAGPTFKFTEAFSLYVNCQDQAEVDELWDKFLSNGGTASQCGWLKDKWGLSWQIIPKRLGELLSDPDKEKANRVMQAMLKMIKIDVVELEKAHEGK